MYEIHERERLCVASKRNVFNRQYKMTEKCIVYSLTPILSHIHLEKRMMKTIHNTTFVSLVCNVSKTTSTKEMLIESIDEKILFSVCSTFNLSSSEEQEVLYGTQWFFLAVCELKALNFNFAN